MRTEETIVNIIFEAGKGTVSVSSREGRCGAPFGELPTPKRKGYRFSGWYCNGERITAQTVLNTDTDVRLVAGWERVRSVRKASSIKRQKWALAALVSVAVMLAIALVVVGRLITIYPLNDHYTVDGVEYNDRYWIKKVDGAYALFHADGTPAERSAPDSNVFIALGSGNQYQIDPETGEYTKFAVVDTVGSEEVGFGNRVLIYPQIQQSYVYSINVKNEHGEYTFVHDVNGVYIDGFKGSAVQYDDKLYASLCTSCGYTLSTMKLDLTSPESLAPKREDGSVDYAAYGLDQPQAVFTIRSVGVQYDKDGRIVYDSKGNPVIVYDEDGNFTADEKQTYTVKVGDAILSQNGYYAQLEGRDEVYVLGQALGDTILQPIEALVTPRAAAPVSVNYHSMGKEFYLLKLDEWTNPDNVIITAENLIASFDYVDLSYRVNTFDTIFPYLPSMDIMKGYNIDTNNANNVFSVFHGMQYLRCAKLGFDYEDLEEFGLDKNVYYLTYATLTGEKDENGNDVYVTNTMLIGEKTEQGTHYIASLGYEMIVEVDQSYLTFLDWDQSDWYYEYFIQKNLAYFKSMTLEVGDKRFDFTMDNSLTYAFYLTTTTDSTGKKVETLKQANKADGSFYSEGADLYFKLHSNSRVYKIEKVIDFETAEYFSYTYALNNPARENIIYIDPDDQIIYRYKRGLEAVIKAEDSTNIRIYCEQYTGGNGEGHLMDYTITQTVTGAGGNSKETFISAAENYANFYVGMMFYSIEGDVDEKEFQKNMGMSVSEYLASAPKPDATISYHVSDLAYFFNGSTYVDEEGRELRVHTKNNEEKVIINFYSYTDWKSMITIEVLEKDENGEWVSGGKPVGKFYVLSSYLEKLVGDAEKVVNEEFVDRKSKY